MNDTMNTVERLTRRRARVAVAMGILFIATQASHFTFAEPLRTVDYVSLAGWAIWSAVLVVFILFGGGLRSTTAVRGLLNDESTEANRRAALVTGFWAMLGASALLFLFTFGEPIAGRDVLHLLVTVGVGAALLRFGALERRALKE